MSTCTPCTPFNPGAVLAVTSVAALAAAAAAAGAGSANEDVELLTVGSMTLEVSPAQAERIRSAVGRRGLWGQVALMSPSGLYSAAAEIEAETRGAALRERTAAARARHQQAIADAASLRELADLVGLVRGTHVPRAAESPLLPGDVIAINAKAGREYYGLKPGVQHVVDGLAGGKVVLRALRADGRRTGKESTVNMNQIKAITQIKIGSEPLLLVERGAKGTP
jgi:hypothetical protein